MRVSLAVVLLLSFGVSGFAQQPHSTLKVKSTASDKAPKSTVPPTKTGTAGTSSAATSKDLQSMEQKSAKTPTQARTAARKSQAASVPKTAKDKPNPPINFGGTGGAKNPGSIKQSSNPYKGRLRQKHSQ
jgi:hypothetical protein